MTIDDSKEKDIYVEQLYYYPIVESDANAPEEFSKAEILKTKPIEDSIKNLNFKHINHKEEKIIVNRIEKFEFELNEKEIMVSEYLYRLRSKLLSIEREENGKKIFYYCFNEKNTFIFEFRFLKNFTYDHIDSLIYTVELNGEIDSILKRPYYHNTDVLLIESIFYNLKKGKEVILKFKSDILNEFVVYNYGMFHIKKNEESIFEVFKAKKR